MDVHKDAWAWATGPWLALGGAALAMGAPLGLWLLWVVDPVPQGAWQWHALTYVGVSTGVVFALVGWTAGRLMQKLVAARQALALEASEDGLTGLPNRREFDRRLRDEMARQRRTLRPLALLMIDIDHFKEVNDTHGHPAGDAVLRNVAACMRRHCRSVDLPARYGGEEFAVILPELAMRDAAVTAERLRAAMAAQRTEFGGHSITVTISIGLACVDADHTTPDGKALIAAADANLFKAKAAGRNQVRVR